MHQTKAHHYEFVQFAAFCSVVLYEINIISSNTYKRLRSQTSDFINFMTNDVLVVVWIYVISAGIWWKWSIQVINWSYSNLEHFGILHKNHTQKQKVENPTIDNFNKTMYWTRKLYDCPDTVSIEKCKKKNKNKKQKPLNETNERKWPNYWLVSK